METQAMIQQMEGFERIGFASAVVIVPVGVYAIEGIVVCCSLYAICSSTIGKDCCHYPVDIRLSYFQYGIIGSNTLIPAKGSLQGLLIRGIDIYGKTCWGIGRKLFMIDLCHPMID